MTCSCVNDGLVGNLGAVRESSIQGIERINAAQIGEDVHGGHIKVIHGLWKGRLDPRGLGEQREEWSKTSGLRLRRHSSELVDFRMKFSIDPKSGTRMGYLKGSEAVLRFKVFPAKIARDDIEVSGKTTRLAIFP
jgi:hypothetical protein